MANPWSDRPDATLVRFADPSCDDAVSRFLSDKPEVLECLFAHVRPLLQSESGTRLAQDMVELLHHWHQGRPAREARVLEDYLVTNDVGLLTKLAEEYALFYALVKDDALRSAILKIVKHPLSRTNNSPIRQVFVRTAHIAKEMPIAKRCEILLAGLGDNPFLIWKTEYRPYDLVCRHYSEVTDDAREHLRNYLESETNAWKVVGRSLGHYYDCLSPHLQEAAMSLATQDDAGSFVARTELIKGLVLGFGQFNNEAHHLIETMLASSDPRTRAYVAGALVPVYDQIDPEWRSRWHHLVERDQRCTVVAAERIVELSTEDTLATTLEGNGLLGLALNCAQSNDPAV
jgi:hypothetical protein